MSYALITGASSGIGRALAERCARHGHDVVLVARDAERLEAVAADLRARFGREARALPVDLSEPNAAARICESVDQLAIEVLVNNAGFGTHGPFLEQDVQTELSMINVNVGAVVGLTRRLLPAMVDRGRGQVLNIASTAGFQAGPLMATYYATKAFVISFSEAVAHELDGSGVTITCHCPGATATEFGDRSGNGRSRLFHSNQVATAEAVADHAFEAMLNGERLAVHGLLNKIGVFATRFGSRRLATRVAAEINHPV